MIVANVVEGWLNVARQKIGIADENVEMLAKVRGEICLACPSVGKNEILCGECGCHVEAKIRATRETCPLKKW